MAKPGKPQSKRTPVRLRHKIEKASAAKQRKQRKLRKNNPEWRSRLKKDPGIPNLFPYKDRLLHEIEEKKRLKEEEFLRKRAELQDRKHDVLAKDDALEPHNPANEEFIAEDEAMDQDSDSELANPMEALLASARARAAEYENVSEHSDEEMDEEASEGGVDVNSNDEYSTSIQSRNHDSSRRAFDKTFKTVVSSADVILYILDARDPHGTRSREIERQITAESGSKGLILILNKIDLVPPTVLKAWLVHLRRSFPTLPLRASHPAPNAHVFDHKALTQSATSETLLRALKTYANNQKLKRSITVGIIGYPNVGKSSVINALTSRLRGPTSSSRSNTTACPVGAEAGITTALREVKLDNKLKLLDSPGIVFPSASGEPPSEAHLTLLNALPRQQISDPLPAISLLLARPALLPSLLKTYNIPPLLTAHGDPTTDFLVQVARKRGRLGKGGVPNLTSAAMSVLTDWRDGRIQGGWVEAPRGDVGPSEVVSGWAAEFQLEGLWGDERA